MKRIAAFFFCLYAVATLPGCGGGTVEEYEGRFTYNGVTYHCTSSEAGDPCQFRRDCSRCDKV